MNETIRKFGYPATLIKEYAYWVVLLRAAQPALGSLILAEKSDAVAFGALTAGSYAELAKVTNDIETVLSAEVGYDRINYLMLMMVDPHVHFHVIPRYSDDREFDGMSFVDAGWPKTPDLSKAITLEAGQIDLLALRLRQAWPNDQ
jgi:diadenosine tetraphosphate (Ap4A) HIT family hydrolase